jgi:hypothetical protein
VPATAGAKPKAPVITKVTPKTASVGVKLTITGKNFKRGKGKNSVLFRRDKGKALFVKADVSTTKKLVVVIPKTLEKYMLTKAQAPIPTRFRLRVLAAKLSKKYTSVKTSPVIGPEKPSNGNGNSGGAGVPTAPDGDCDSDGLLNGVDADDDNDLLPDALELALLLDPCAGDTDGDGVEDGYEYQSAIDLNNDDYQHPNASIPYPAKTPYPNPLFKDADRDYDGDGLVLSEEYKLWKYTYEVNHTATRTLSPLSYSDGLQYSLSYLSGGNGVRTPSMTVAAYRPPQNFRAWAASSGYATPMLFDPGSHNPRTSNPYDLYDMDRDGVVTTVARAFDGNPPLVPHSGKQLSAEATYWDMDDDGYVSDDERDEDADGLTNYDEDRGPLTAGWWEACYPEDGKYPIDYAGTKAYDADSDGDGILDGADDQDFDDVPNIMELSRNMAGNVQRNGSCGGPGAHDPSIPAKAYVNPFNPCLPDVWSRTCQRHPVIGGQGYAPFIDNWEPSIRN